jgi:hypothetical protein
MSAKVYSWNTSGSPCTMLAVLLTRDMDGVEF